MEAELTEGLGRWPYIMPIVITDATFHIVFWQEPGARVFVLSRSYEVGSHVAEAVLSIKYTWVRSPIGLT
jgi:hypothetical protein